MLRMILTCVQVFASFVIVGLVLLQRGKGAEAGAGFGAGASGTVFGARGATTALSRTTAVFAAIFMINSLWLAYLGTSVSRQQAQEKTILDEAAEKGKRATGAAAPLPVTPPPASAPPSTPAPAPAPK
jgi:preprotein translocase subunit SecG